MAEIGTYLCSNTRCAFTLRLSKGFHSRTESFCRYCKKVVLLTEDKTCAHCKNGGLYDEEVGRLCPQCLKGAFSIKHLSVF